MFVKSRLMTPGPTQIGESTRLAMAMAHPHHRSAEFEKVFSRLLELLRWLWDTEDETLFLTGSGTMGMEAALRSCIKPGERVLVVTGGKFAERWSTICKTITSNVVELPVEYGHSANLDALKALLEANAEFDAFVSVASETSTGSLHPVAEMLAMFQQHSPRGLTCIDGITAVGCMDLSMKRHGIDVLVSGSQKAFGLPPGAAIAGVSARAWEKVLSYDSKGYYLDLRREKKQKVSGETGFTPNIPLVFGFHEVLERWHPLGRDFLFAHSDCLSKGAIAGVKALGLELYPQDLVSPSLTSMKVPAGLSGSAIIGKLRDQYGITITGGQDTLKGKILRIGHLGAVDAFDILATVSAFELVLRELGWTIAPGTGAGAALAAMSPFLLANPAVRYNP